MVNKIWPTAVAVEADSVSSVSASACHIGGPNSVNPGQILLVYGSNFQGLQRIMINYPNARPSSRGYLVDNFIKVCVAIRLSISRLICPNEGYVASH